MTLVHLVIDLADQEHGRRRAERNIDLPAVPRQGEAIWVSRSLALMVKSVTWMLAEATPWLFLGRAEGTLQSVVENDGELTMPETYVDELPASGWTISES